MSAELHKLSNGTTVIIDQIPHTEAASIAYYFRVGSRYENKSENGLAHFLEHMAFKGTDRFNAHELSVAMDDLGARSNAFTSHEATAYYMVGGAEDVFTFNDYLSNMAIKLSLPEAEIEMERGAILSEIDMYADNPSSLSSDNLFSTAYRNQAMGRTILGPKRNIKAFDKNTFERFRKKHYHTGNLIVTVAGNIDPQAILKDIERRTADMHIAKRSRKSKATFTGGEAKLIKPINQVSLVTAFETSAGDSPDKAAENVLQYVLSGGMSSRLFTEIREKRGLVYGVGAQGYNLSDTGMLLISAGTAPDNVEKLMPVLSDELNKVASQKISDEELKRAKKQMLTARRLQKDSVSGRMQSNAGAYNLTQRIPDDKRIEDRINAVTKEDVLNVAQKIFSGECVISSVGPEKHPTQKMLTHKLKI